MYNNKYTRYTYKKKYLDMKFDLDTFDPEKNDYTDSELEAYTDLLLWKHKEEQKNGPEILFQEHIESSRWSREVLSANGVPDDEITHATSNDGQTMYWRYHPQGRRLNSEKNRIKNGASIYRLMPHDYFDELAVLDENHNHLIGVIKNDQQYIQELW